MAYRARLKEFDYLLQEDVVDVKTLKSLCFNGIPDDHGRRALCWKLLLNYLPTERATWSSFLQKKRDLYRQFIDEMIVTPGAKETNGDVTFADHPLNVNPDSQWQTYFKDNEVLLQIDKDVRRLCPDISFFQQPTEFPCSEIVNSNDVKRLHTRVQRSVLKCANVERKGLGITKIALSVKKAAEDYAPMTEGKEAHWEVVERILFLYAKLNPGQSYVQGMNEIIGPIYYSFACDPNAAFREHAESDCFFCFTNLMSEIRDFFIKTLDEADCGINNMMSKLLTQLKNNDLEVWLRFQQQELRPQYYSFREQHQIIVSRYSETSFMQTPLDLSKCICLKEVSIQEKNEIPSLLTKWITLLLSQEFPLPDVLRIWDSLFSDENRFNFLIYICCAMIIIVRDQLVEGDFPSNLKLLQNFPSMDVSVILTKAVELSQMKV